MAEVPARDFVAEQEEAAGNAATEYALTYRGMLDLAFKQAGIEIPGDLSLIIDDTLVANGKANFSAGSIHGFEQGTALAARLTIPIPQR